MASRLTLNDSRFRKWSGRLKRGQGISHDDDYHHREVEYRIEVVSVRVDRYLDEDGVPIEYEQEVDRRAMDYLNYEVAGKLWRALLSVLHLVRRQG